VARELECTHNLTDFATECMHFKHQQANIVGEQCNVDPVDI